MIRRPAPSPIRALAGAALTALATGCMPWLAGETAETLPPGQWAAGAGLGLVAPPDQPHRPLAVPQAWAAVGLTDGVDAALTYAAPLTFQARARVRIMAGAGPGPALAVTGGAGVHGFPDVAGIGHTVWTPYLLAGAHASRSGPGATPYGGVRTIAPFVLGAEPAATLWVVPYVGVELGGDRIRWGPELGMVIRATRIGEPQLVAGLSVRWVSLP